MSFFLNVARLTATPDRTSPEDLEIGSTADLEKSVGSKELIALYNKAVPSSPIKKFVNRATGVVRVYPLLESMARGTQVEESTDKSPWNLGEDSPADAAPDAGPDPKEDNVATATGGKKKGAKGAGKKKATKSAAAASNGKRGRTASLAGAKLFRVGDENPCRGGGLRAASWDLIRDGMKYETYIEKGGRPQELAFNVRQGRVRVEREK